MVVRYRRFVVLHLLLLLMGKIQAKVTYIEHDRAALDSKQPMVIKFAARWCGTCQSIAELFESVSDEAEFHHIIFMCIDIDAHEEISKQYGVIGVPTFAYLENGSKKGQIIGAKDVSSFKDNLRESIRFYFNVSPNKSTTVAIAPVLDVLKTVVITGEEGDSPLQWVWNSFVHFFDDVAQMFRRVFA